MLGFQVALAANLVLPIRQRSPFLCSSRDGDTWALGKTSQGPSSQGGTGYTPCTKQHAPSNVAGTSVQTEPRRDVTTPGSSSSWSAVAAGGLLTPCAMGHLAGFSPTNTPLFSPGLSRGVRVPCSEQDLYKQRYACSCSLSRPGGTHHDHKGPTTHCAAGCSCSFNELPYPAALGKKETLCGIYDGI